MEDQTFNLLHLSIVRRYLEFDFIDLKEQINFEFDIDRIIDDWVLMGFLAGNDFVPHLPGLHIKQEGLPYLHKKYVSILPKLDGYISDAGRINLPRFQKFMSSLAEFDLQEFQEHYVSMAYIKRKRSEKRAKKENQSEVRRAEEQKEAQPDDDNDEGLEPFTDFMGMDPDFVMSPVDEPEDINKELSSLGISQIPEELLQDPEDTDVCFLDIKSLYEKSMVPMELSEEAFTDVNFSVDFKKYKRKYYENKFKLSAPGADLAFLQDLAYQYILGLQWVLLYYYQGVRSWNWFYPFHYAPFVSDINDLEIMNMEFNLSQPFEPYQQLMSVLPSLSSDIVPPAFRKLMVDNNSPIINFYPSTFETDLNGKTHEWEAVVLLPFIEVDLLLLAMHELYDELTEAEVARNKPGMLYKYSYKTEKQKTVQAPFENLPEISPCFSVEEELSRDHFPYEIDSLPKGLLQGANLESYIPGYPTFNFVSHTKKKEVRQTYMNNIIVEKQRIHLNVREPQETLTLESVANKLVGKECLVNWPFLVRAFVEAVSDRNQVYELDPDGKERGMRVTEMDERERDKWEKNAINIDHVYSSKNGVNLGSANFMVHANVVVGKRVQFCKKKEDHPIRVDSEWDTNGNLYLLQTVLTFDEVQIFDPSPPLSELTLSDIFFKGRECYIMRKDLYGSPAIVDKVDEVSRQIQLKMYSINNQTYTRDMLAINEQYLKTLPRFRRYLPGFIIASKADIDKIVLSRITSGLFIYTGDLRKKSYSSKLMISLNIKNSKKNLCLSEYAIREDKGWLYNPRIIDYLKEYKQRFPEVFAILEYNPTCDDYYSCDMFEDESAVERLAELKAWLMSLPCYEQTLVTCGSELLNTECIKMVEEITNDSNKDIATRLKSNRKIVKCKPKELFCPMFEFSEFAPDRDAVYYILDRVISISSEVPFGYVGTIIGYYPLSSKDHLCEVLFDIEFPGAVSIRGSAKRAYTLKSSLLIDLTHGHHANETQESVYQEGVFGCDDLENMENHQQDIKETHQTSRQLKSQIPKDPLKENLGKPADLPTVPFISHIHKPRGPRGFGNRYDMSQMDPYGTSPNTLDMLDPHDSDSADTMDNSHFMELETSGSLQGKSVNIYPSSVDNSIVGDLSWLEDSQPQFEPPRDFRKSKQQRQPHNMTHHMPPNRPLYRPNPPAPEMLFDPRANIRMPLIHGYPTQNIFQQLMASSPHYTPNISPRFNNFNNAEPNRFPPPYNTHYQFPHPPPPGLLFPPNQNANFPPSQNANFPLSFNSHPLPTDLDLKENIPHTIPIVGTPYRPNFSPHAPPPMPGNHFQSPPRPMNPHIPFPPHHLPIQPVIRLPPNFTSFRDVLEQHCLALGLGFPDYQHMNHKESNVDSFIGMVKINVDGTLQTFMGAPSRTLEDSYESAACKTLYELQPGPLVERGMKSPSPPILPPHPLFAIPRPPHSCFIPSAVIKNLAHQKAIKNRIVEKESGQTLLTAQQATQFASKPESDETHGDNTM